MRRYWYDHVHIISDDPKKTAAYYVEMFGGKITRTRETDDGRIFVDVDLGGSPVKIGNPRPEPLIPGKPQTGLQHFGINVEDVDAAMKELKAKGVEVLEDVKLGHTPGLKRAFLLAPEGVMIELQQLPE